MNIKELDERIKQLKDLVASANDTIKLAEEMVGLAEKEMDKLADQKKGEPKFERAVSTYYTFGFDYGVCTTYKTNDQDLNSDIQRYKNNCYFHTEERAQEVADKINLLLKLERLHDIYCPNCESGKYYISQNTESGRYCYGYIRNVPNKFPTSTMFPTEEIAQKVCDILNAELEGKNG